MDFKLDFSRDDHRARWQIQIENKPLEGVVAVNLTEGWVEMMLGNQLPPESKVLRTKEMPRATVIRRYCDFDVFDLLNSVIVHQHRRLP